MSTSWFDPRVPAADLCVLRPLLDRHAAATPDKVFARFADGTEWTYRQTQAIARRTATGLAALGVAQGDKVLSWLPNGPDAIRVWFGLNYLGCGLCADQSRLSRRLLAHVVRQFRCAADRGPRRSCWAGSPTSTARRSRPPSC